MFSCYNVAKMVTDEATEVFGASVTENPEKKANLKAVCDAIDEFLEESNGVSCEVEVDEDTRDITVTLVTNPFEVEKDTTYFQEMMKRSKRMEFSSANADEVCSKFLLDGIWDVAEN
jgi:hypothetical protein